MKTKQLENKMVKHYWRNCLDTNNGELSIEEIDDSKDFDCIPRNKKGKIELEVGELRDIIHNTILMARQFKN